MLDPRDVVDTLVVDSGKNPIVMAGFRHRPLLQIAKEIQGKKGAKNFLAGINNDLRTDITLMVKR